ncbi:MAG: PAS domain-containing protein [Desulfobulbaceae bacterium]|uniref:PAS domain-containing protein n=1 Tax=Candidatus Desulfatifera sulfidica TaxID=2841691 RepID=A0A8J6NBN5_9BACT|nr:PAS domain-containing protein [Candidatus Desulfatifera sulfidica]
MSIKNRTILLITLLFTGYATLLYILTPPPSPATVGPSPFLWLLTSLAIFFIALILLIISGHSKYIFKIKEQTEEIAELNKAIKESQGNFDEILERRTFELSVINGSLNREIAERIQTEKESARLQERFEMILNSAGEGIFGLDADGNVTFINKAASLMLGWEIEDLIGKSHHQLVHHTHANGEHYHEEHCPIYQAYKDGEVHFKSDDVFWTKSGHNFPVEYVSTPIIENNQYTGAVVVFRDLNTFS